MKRANFVSVIFFPSN